MKYEMFRVSKEGHVATVTVDRPPVNAFTEASRYEAVEIFDALSEDPDVRVVILTGEGKYFSGGVDIKQRARVTDAAYYRKVARMSLSSTQAVKDCRKPVIGAMNGPAIGVGAVFMLSCDILVASDDAYLSMPEINRGMAGGVKVMSRAFSPWRARWAFLCAGRIPAADLARVDVVQEVVPKGQVVAAAMRIAEVIVSKPPLAVMAAKAAFAMAEALPYREASVWESDVTSDLAKTEDSQEAMLSFVEKRTPVFHGR